MFCMQYPPTGYAPFYANPPNGSADKLDDQSNGKERYAYGTPAYGAQAGYPPSYPYGGQGGFAPSGPYGAPPQGYYGGQQPYGAQPQYYGGGQPVYVQQHSSPNNDMAGGLCAACLGALCCCCLVSFDSVAFFVYV